MDLREAGAESPRRIVATPTGAAPPFPIDAVVLEEDTYLVLSARRDIPDAPVENLVQLLEAAVETSPLEPGTVIVRDEPPLKFLAVVHDLDRDPTCEEDWVARALHEVFREAAWRGVASVALPVLGAQTRSISTRRFVALLRDALEWNTSPYPEAIWLDFPPETSPEEIAVLRDFGAEIRT